MRDAYRQSKLDFKKNMEMQQTLIKRMFVKARQVEADKGLSLDLNKINYLAQLHDQQLIRLSDCYDLNTAEMKQRIEKRHRSTKAWLTLQRGVGAFVNLEKEENQEKGNKEILLQVLR